LAIPYNPKIYIKFFLLELKIILRPIIIMVGPLKSKMWRSSSATGFDIVLFDLINEMEREC
jgi:hypothetical protein